MLKERHEVTEDDKWNVEELYPTLKDWQEAFKQLPSHSQIQKHKGNLHKNAETLKEALDLIMSASRNLYKLYTYSHLRHDEDIAQNDPKVAYNQALSSLHDFYETISWFEPELLALPDDTLKNYLSSPILADYHFHLEKIVRMKAHTLSPNEESLLALSAKSLQSPSKAFSALNDADFNFGEVLDSSKTSKPLTHATFAIYLRDQDRTLRKNAFNTMHEKYTLHQNTLCELLNGNVQSHLFNAKARKYKSCLEASLYPKNIELDVYHSLIDAVNKNLKPLHRYIDLRKKVLKLDTMNLYDLHVPLTPNIDIKKSYPEAEELVIESVAPLGAEYQELLREGLKNGRWVDRYENKNKRSGAYSSGCYDSMPYILMNYKELLRDVFTLAHEAGHSMHSLLSHKNQPFQYSEYPIFLAEVASTFNEELLTQYLLKHCNDPQERIFLINQKIEDIRATLFRQTMFAEFELFIHETAEKNIPLTPQLLNETYHQLNEKYYGIANPEGDIEWARIPHFYYNFYVYQYATGISAALSLAARVTNGSTQEQQDYLNFLKSGCSKYPIQTLQSAGVNMLSVQPVTDAITKFDLLVQELENLLV